MNIGITFGGFCPLHKGHMEMILQGKKENDYMFVTVCGYDDEERMKKMNITLDEKYEMIKNFLEDDIIKVIKINDAELNILDSNNKNNWYIWMDEVLKQINQFNLSDNYTLRFYVSEKEYFDDIINLKDKYPFVDAKIVSKVPNISGTECRNDPIKHWYEIMKPFRSKLSHNILISGTASEGKTTLVNDLAKYFSLTCSYEKGRDISKIKKDNEFNLDDFIYFIDEQRKLQQELIDSDSNRGVFIGDTDFCTTLMYANAYSKRNDFTLSENDYNYLFEKCKNYSKEDKWNKIFLISPSEKDIVDDGVRYMGDSDYSIRKDFFDNLKQLYDYFGYEYEVLDGSYYDNYLKIKKYIENIF